MPTPIPTQAQIAAQLNRLQATGFDQMLANSASANGLTTAFVYGIASRETNCVNELGDFHADGAHGIGIMQIDIQHPIALAARDSSSWKTNPGPLIDFGTALLASDLVQVQNKLPGLDTNATLKVVASGYNCGIVTAINATTTGNGDSDTHTTGGNYGAYVIAVMLLFEQLGV